MFQVQQAPRKERSRLASFTAPANMLSLRASPQPATSVSSTSSTQSPIISNGVSSSPSTQNAAPPAAVTDNISSPRKRSGSKTKPSNPTATDIAPPPQLTAPSVPSRTSSASKVPTSQKPHADPYDAPGVTFKSSLKPPANAVIPDIPYGEGRSGHRKQRSSGSTSGHARVFTPSDAAVGIRRKPDKQVDYTAMNAGIDRDGPTTTIIASSGPATHLFTPSAPLTVNAPIVAPPKRQVTNVEAAHQEYGVGTAGGPPMDGSGAPPQGVTSPSKQPVKSAMKAKSWADLVRPMNNVQLAEQTVKNLGMSPQAIKERDAKEASLNNNADAARAQAAYEQAKKKRVSIALPGGANSEAGSEVARTAEPVQPGSPAPDKSPRHSSPPPHATSVLAGAGQDVQRPVSPTPTSASAHETLLTSIVSSKKSLADILAGVENSSSSVILYPRGLVNTGNACFMNSILQALLFTGPFYNLITLIGSHTSEDLSGKTPLLDAMVSYLSEFKKSNVVGDGTGLDRELQLRSGEGYQESPGTGTEEEAFIPSIIYHALNHNSRFKQMGFYNPTKSNSVASNPFVSGSTNGHQKNPNALSQEDAQEFLGFFLDTLHEELLIKIQQYDKQTWQKATKGYKAGLQSFTRASVNGASDFDAQQRAMHLPSAPAGLNAETASVIGPSSAKVPFDDFDEDGPGGDQEGSMVAGGAGDSEDWLEVGQKGRTATTRTTETSESAITKIFGGQLRSVLKVPGSKDSNTLEPFMSLQLEIQNPSIYSISDALSQLAVPETLSDVTNKQNLKVEATKQVFIETLPPVLILHLKRFVYDLKTGNTLKSQKIISYDTELDIPKDLLAPSTRKSGSAKGGQKTRYRLMGVVYHHGKTAQGGHYTVNIRQLSKAPPAGQNGQQQQKTANGSGPGDRWINIDDTMITPVTPDQVAVDHDRERMRLSLPSNTALHGVQEKSAYLLFYQRI